MALRIHNTLTKQKEEFVPLRPGKVGMYVCGVTVYDLCHVGHARCYVTFDVVQRWLRERWQVTYVRNFTDVDDKIIKRAREQGVDPLQLSNRFADEFHVDMERLGVARADVEPRVSTHIQEIVAFCADLVERGYAYRVKTQSDVEGAGDDVYFRVKKFPTYMELSGRHLEDLMSGARVSVDERKEDPLDFALWKSAKPGEPSWDSPFGKGRPGWHIECSAMSLKHLGETFDLHGGGKDLVFPHHTNEIAQSEARHEGKKLSKYWMHNGFVSVAAEEGEEGDDVEEIVDERGAKVKVRKMSKSLGNFFTIRDVLAKYTAESLRFLLLGTHYRSPIAFGPRLLDEAEKRVQYFYDTRRRVARYLASTPVEDGPSLEHAFGKQGVPFHPWKDFEDALDDDFNTPMAIAALVELMKVANLVVDGKERELTGQKMKPGHRARVLVEWTSHVDRMAAVLGVGRADPATFLAAQRTQRMLTKGIDVLVVEKLVGERADARQRKDWAAADAARAELTTRGIEIRDAPDGTTEWSVQ